MTKPGCSEEQSWEADEQKSQTTFPVGTILILLSFTIMLFLEQTFAKTINVDPQNERIPIIILTKVLFDLIKSSCSYVFNQSRHKMKYFLMGH